MLNTKVVRVKTEAQERKESFIQMVFWAAIWLVLLHHLTACTIKIDAPWYPPSTIDVNKATSTGANNYIKAPELKEARKLTPGMAE